MILNGKKTGFSLIELLIAITIIAIVSTVGFTTFSQSQLRARDSKRKTDLKAISVALELFYQRNGRFPCASWISSGSGNDWLKDVTGTSPCPASTVSLAPTYISSAPEDPVNTGLYVYRLWTMGWSSCNPNQGYMLVSELENPSDPDTIGNSPTDICGTTSPQTAGAGGTSAWGTNLPTANSYIISRR